MRDRVTLLGMPFDPWTIEETKREILRRMTAGQVTQHGVINVAKLVASRTDRGLFDAVTGCDIINADGMGIVWGARFLGLDVPERVAGIDLFHELLRLGQQHHFSAFFLGAREDVVERAVARIRETCPGLPIAGWHHGYFWEDEAAVVRQIAASGADMLFVAISPPKKETFIARWTDALGVRFVMGVGGTFDVVAGVTRRAPRWMQRAGLEWLFRLLQEPRRMAGRYLYTNVIFAGMLIAAKWRAVLSPSTSGREGR